MNGRFENLRYEELASAHIEKLKKDHPVLWRQWTGSIRNIICNKFDEGYHLSGGEVHPLLVGFKEFLDADPDGQNALYEEIKAAPAGPVKTIQKTLMELVLQKEKTNIKEAFEKIFTLLQDQLMCPLFQDLKLYQQTVIPKELNKDCFLINSDDRQDLFLSGTEVVGSCQTITGGSFYNCCLLGYVLDGKNQMIAVKSKKTNKIVGRAILKLLFKEKGGAPVLFLDQIYPNFPNLSEYAQDIIQYAKDIAASLKLDLYKLGAVGAPERLKSLGSPAPFEYEDALSNVIDGVTNGAFSLIGFKLE